MIKIFVITLFVLLCVFTVNYYAEVNRLVLLLAVYPSCFFTGLGLIAWIESSETH